MIPYLGMEPDSYCTQCGAPMYRIFERLCHTCLCSGIEPIAAYPNSTNQLIAEEPRFFYEGKCEHCGGSMWRSPRGSLHSCPVNVHIDEQETVPALPVVTAQTSDIEEVTSERASKIYQSIYRAIWRHQAICKSCDILAKADTMCYEQMEMWCSLRWWSKKIDEATV